VPDQVVCQWFSFTLALVVDEHDITAGKETSTALESTKIYWPKLIDRPYQRTAEFSPSAAGGPGQSAPQLSVHHCGRSDVPHDQLH
jgi:hypothetical protein